MKKNVQIPWELFVELVRYHLLESEYADGAAIRKGLEEKIDHLAMHELYGRYKTAEDPADCEKARQEYLDARGVPQDFRW